MTMIDKRMETIVQRILEEDELTRRSDDVLWIEYIRRSDYAYYLDKPFSYVVRHTNDIGLPKRSSVSRARRKVQERHPELKDATIAAYRADLEEQFRDYART